MVRNFFLPAIICILLSGCATPVSVSMLDSSRGGMAAAYSGNIDDMLVDLRALLIQDSPYRVSSSDLKFIDEGSIKGYAWNANPLPMAARLKVLLIPAKGISDKGKETAAYALEVSESDRTLGALSTYWYQKIRAEFDAKYHLVRVK